MEIKRKIISIGNSIGIIIGKRNNFKIKKGDNVKAKIKKV